MVSLPARVIFCFDLNIVYINMSGMTSGDQTFLFRLRFCSGIPLSLYFEFSRMDFITTLVMNINCPLKKEEDLNAVQLHALLVSLKTLHSLRLVQCKRNNLSGGIIVGEV